MLNLWKNKLLPRIEPYDKAQTIFETSIANTYNLNIEVSGVYEVTLVGGGGAAAMKGVYDDRGYGWSGGSGGAFSGTFALNAGTYEVVVASANNNTAGQGGNTNTMNPSDTSTHDSIIAGVLSVGGGGSGTTSGVGAAGASATFTLEPLKTSLNTSGNAGAYGSGGKGSGANWTHNGGASVYEGYGKGQGCSTSEYANRRYWIAGTGGYIKVVYLRQVKKFNLTINTNVEGAEVVMDGITSNSLSFVEGTTVNYTVSKDGYVTKTGSVRVLEDTIVDVELAREMMTVTVNPVPDDSVVVLTADGYTQEGNSITAHKYSTIAWEVARNHYIAQNGSFVLTEATELNVELEAIMRTFTINPTPADAIVTINGEVRNSVTLLEGSEVSWSVEADKHKKQTGELVLNEDTVMDVVLEERKSKGFVVVGEKTGTYGGEATNVYVHSEDGINWKQSTLPSSQLWMSVAYGNGKFVAISGDWSASNICAYSEDGINWKTANMPSSTYWSSVTYGNGKFVAVAGGQGLMGDIPTNICAYSEDGINWIQATLPVSEGWFSVTYGNGKFVAVAGYSNVAAHSEDGINWKQSTLPSNTWWHSVTYGNGKFVAVEPNSKIAAYSTNGINWSTSTLPFSPQYSSNTSLVYGNGKFVVFNLGTSNIYAYSEDGINWKTANMPSSQSWFSVTYGIDKFVAVVSKSNICAYSEDGINWIQATLPVSASWRAITSGEEKE